MKKARKENEYNTFYKSLDNDSLQKINLFFKDLKGRMYKQNKFAKLLKNDFEKAFVKYDELGISFSRSLELLDLSNLGGFYSRPSNLWLPLDDVAKYYTQWVDNYTMSVFRLSCYLKEDIIPELLQMALNFTIKRFPQFAMSIKNGFFWNYLDSLRRRFEVEEEKPLPVQRMHLTFASSKTFRVIYYKNRISVEFFHCMTDGTGALEFLKSLLQSYLILNDKKINLDNNIINSNDIINIEEYDNAFTNIERSKELPNYINKKALQLGGKLAKEKPCRVLHFKIPTDELVNVSKKYGVSVTSFVASKILNACKYSIDEINGELSLQIPVNLRNFYPSKTLRNFALYFELRSDIKNVNDSDEFAKSINNSLKEKCTKDIILKMIAQQAGIVHKIRYIPLFIKQPFCKSLYKAFGDRTTTTVLSNLGNVILPDDISKEVESFDFVLGTSDLNRAICSLISVNNVSILTISKNTTDPSFEEKLYDLLIKEDINISVEGSEQYGC